LVFLLIDLLMSGVKQLRRRMYRRTWITWASHWSRSRPT